MITTLVLFGLFGLGLIGSAWVTSLCRRSRHAVAYAKAWGMS